MHTSAQSQSTSRRPPPPSLPIYANEGLSPKKTALIIVTVVGCIAILWPKVFYPMMFASAPTAASGKTNIKEGHRGPGGIRQERPSHLHPDSVYQAMRERGRAIPATPTIPIVERKSSPSNPPPRIVEGRPGPIPGMRPPMGAGALHQPQGKGQNSMGIIMPLYTIGIVVFFGYTIMKIVFKKQVPNAPYGAAPHDPNFRKEVFGQENGRHVEDLNGSKLGWREHQTNIVQPHHLHSQQQQQQLQQQHLLRGSDLYNASLSAQTAATNLSSSFKQHQLQQQQQQQQLSSKLLTKENDQLMEIEKLRKKLEDTEKAMAKLIAEMNSDQYEAKKNSNENSTTTNQQQQEKQQQQENISNGHANINETTSGDDNSRVDDLKAMDDDKRKKREGSTDRTVSSKHEDEDKMPEPQEIYLEGSLAHDSQILVAESETKQEKVYDAELNGSPEEPAVILSSKMTLSLINLDNIMDKKSPTTKPTDLESPLADDIEIISHDEQ